MSQEETKEERRARLEAKWEEQRRPYKERLERLRTKYPKVIKDLDNFWVEEGWMPLLNTLCHNLEQYVETLPMEIKDEIYCVQVKEKFGGLCFYMHQYVPYVSGAIQMAQIMSYSICEMCGMPGEPRKLSWVKTLCDKCHQDKKEEGRK